MRGYCIRMYSIYKGDRIMGGTKWVPEKLAAKRLRLRPYELMVMRKFGMLHKLITWKRDKETGRILFLAGTLNKQHLYAQTQAH